MKMKNLSRIALIVAILLGLKTVIALWSSISYWSDYDPEYLKTLQFIIFETISLLSPVAFLWLCIVFYKRANSVQQTDDLAAIFIDSPVGKNGNRVSFLYDAKKVRTVLLCLCGATLLSVFFLPALKLNYSYTLQEFFQRQEDSSVLIYYILPAIALLMTFGNNIFRWIAAVLLLIPNMIFFVKFGYYTNYLESFGIGIFASLIFSLAYFIINALAKPRLQTEQTKDINQSTSFFASSKKVKALLAGICGVALLSMLVFPIISYGENHYIDLLDLNRWSEDGSIIMLFFVPVIVALLTLGNKVVRWIGGVILLIPVFLFILNLDELIHNDYTHPGPAFYFYFILALAYCIINGLSTSTEQPVSVASPQVPAELPSEESSATAEIVAEEEEKS